VPTLPGISERPNDLDLQQESLRLLDCARRSVVDHSCWWLDDNLEPIAEFGKQLWITTRMAHVLALGDNDASRHAEHSADTALASLSTDFYDATHGGWFPRRNSDGSTEPSKQMYGHAFVVLAAATGVVTGRAGTSSLLRQAVSVVNEYFWDEQEGALRESWNADWSHCEPYRGANANMHGVEAFIAAADATGNDLWIERALRISQRIVDHARAANWRVPEHFDARWHPDLHYNDEQPRHQFRPPGATPGHGCEWARLLVQLWARDNSQQWALDAARELFQRAMADGWDEERGGLCYTTTFNGEVLVADRFHWVHCEAVLAANFLARATADPSFARWESRIWGYMWPRFPDRVRGGWHHELDVVGQPAEQTWRGKPDVYHAYQACLAPQLQLDRSVAASVVAWPKAT